MDHLTLTHIGITGIFTLFFSFKTVLLLTGSDELLTKIRDKGKMIDMVLGLLVIASGLYIWSTKFNWGHMTWLDIKMTLVIVSIPLGIISMKKENKILAAIVASLLIGIFSYMFIR